MIKDELEVYTSYDGEDITILVRIDYYKKVKADSRADNPDDYYGYTEVDYTVLKIIKDETDEELPESILTDKDNDLIVEKINEYNE